MSDHLSAEEISAYLSRSLRPPALLNADRHLSDCGLCQGRLNDSADAISNATTLAANLRAAAGSPLQHLSYELLRDFVDGNADSIDSEMVEGHVEVCARCRDDLAELKSFRELLGIAASSEKQTATSPSWQTRPRGPALYAGGPPPVEERGPASTSALASAPQGSGREQRPSFWHGFIAGLKGGSPTAYFKLAGVFAVVILAGSAGLLIIVSQLQRTASRAPVAGSALERGPEETAPPAVGLGSERPAVPPSPEPSIRVGARQSPVIATIHLAIGGSRSLNTGGPKGGPKGGAHGPGSQASNELVLPTGETRETGSVALVADVGDLEASNESGEETDQGSAAGGNINASTQGTTYRGRLSRRGTRFKGTLEGMDSKRSWDLGIAAARHVAGTSIVTFRVGAKDLSAGSYLLTVSQVAQSPGSTSPEQASERFVFNIVDK